MECLSVEGAQFLVLLKQEVRAEAARYFGFSPEASRFVKVCVSRGWFDDSALRKYYLLIVEDGCQGGSDVPEEYLGIIGSRSSYGAVPATELGAIAGSGLRLGPSCYAAVQVGAEPTRESFPHGIEVDQVRQVVDKVVGDEGIVPNKIHTLESVVDEYLDSKVLMDFDVQVAETPMLEHVARVHKLERDTPCSTMFGYCYMDLFQLGFSYAAVKELGFNPALRRLLLYYLAAIRRGVAVGTCRLYAVDRRAHVVESKDGTVASVIGDMLELLEIDEDMTVAGFGNLCCNTGSLFRPVCKACKKPAPMRHLRVEGVCDSCGVSHDGLTPAIGFAPSSEMKEDTVAVVAVRGDLCRQVVAGTVEETIERVPCAYSWLGRGSYVLPLHRNMAAGMPWFLEIEGESALVALPAGLYCQVPGASFLTVARTLLLTVGKVKVQFGEGADAMGVAALSVRVGTRDDTVRWSHMYLGEDSSDTFARFWSASRVPVVIGSFGCVVSGSRVPTSAASVEGECVEDDLLKYGQSQEVVVCGYEDYNPLYPVSPVEGGSLLSSGLGRLCKLLQTTKVESDSEYDEEQEKKKETVDGETENFVAGIDGVLTWNVRVPDDLYFHNGLCGGQITVEKGQVSVGGKLGGADGIVIHLQGDDSVLLARRLPGAFVRGYKRSGGHGEVDLILHQAQDAYALDDGGPSDDEYGFMSEY